MALLQKKQAEEYKALGIHQEDEVEEADTMAQLKHITKAHKEDTNLKQTKQYSKGLSVNQFSNFSGIMHDLHNRSVETQHSQSRGKSQGACNRSNCKAKAGTFFQGLHHTHMTQAMQSPRTAFFNSRLSKDN